MSWRLRLTSAAAWSDVAYNFRADWRMLWKEITIGFLLAGFIGLLGDDFFNGLFVTDAPAGIETVENVIAGQVIAVLSFVCSIGNVPLAAVLWSGGISFAGVIAFIFADLIVLPIVAAYRKYYGWEFAWRITALMFVTIVIAALLVDALFSALGLIPETRPSREEIFGSIELDYKLVLNVIALAAFSALFYLTMRPPADRSLPPKGDTGLSARSRISAPTGKSSEDCTPVIDPLQRWRQHGGKPDYAGLLTFGGLPYTEDPAELAGSDVAIVGAPTDDLVSDRPGARFGPRAIRAAS